MKIVFHIGMGKTGTSSIQKALEDSFDILAKQKVAYLGMWFDVIDPSFGQHYDGIQRFFNSTADEMKQYAENFYNSLSAKAQKDDIDTFIFSNEEIYAQVFQIIPFIQSLIELMDVSIIVYVRSPQSWLPSAHTQWGIKHKVMPGNIQPITVWARNYIGVYGGLMTWSEHFEEQLSVRLFSKQIDCVKDFAQTLNITLIAETQRILERGDDIDILMRGLYNDRFDEPVLPDEFNKAILQRPNFSTIDDMKNKCFNYDGIDEILLENSELFDFIKDRFGLDFIGANVERPKPIDDSSMHIKLLDYLMEISLNQARRLIELENQVEILTNKLIRND